MDGSDDSSKVPYTEMKQLILLKLNTKSDFFEYLLITRLTLTVLIKF